jgi:hypothetical protein
MSEVVLLAHLTSLASVPVAVTGCMYLGVRMVVLLVAVFGPKKEWADRALQVLKILRKDRPPK